MNHRELPFERVIVNLRKGVYKGKVQSADYANTGIQVFNKSKFCQQLGVSEYDLREMGLLTLAEQSGWNLIQEPSVEKLLNYRTKIESLKNTLRKRMLAKHL